MKTELDTSGSQRPAECIEKTKAGGSYRCRCPGIPTTRTPVTNDCGQPVMLFGSPVFEYTAMLPGSINVPPGESIYVGVRGVGSGSYNSRLLSAHRDTESPVMRSYYLAPSQGIPSAVPVSNVLNCDHDFVVQTIGQH